MASFWFVVQCYFVRGYDYGLEVAEEQSRQYRNVEILTKIRAHQKKWKKIGARATNMLFSTSFLHGSVPTSSNSKYGQPSNMFFSMELLRCEWSSDESFINGKCFYEKMTLFSWFPVEFVPGVREGPEGSLEDFSRKKHEKTRKESKHRSIEVVYNYLKLKYTSSRLLRR